VVINTGVSRLRLTVAALTDPAKVHEVLFWPVRRLGIRRRVTVASDSLASVVLVTNRPAQLDHALASFDRQQYRHKELILVTNGGDFPATRMLQLAARTDVTCLTTPAEMTLGAALNRGADAASGRVIAKFDDDDHYGPDHLSESVEAMRRTGAGVVGKKTYYLYMESTDRTVLIYPGNEGRRVGRVAGGTIVAHRDVFDRVRFPALNLGEDVAFVRAVERRGFGVHSTEAAGFLQWRAASGHTWAFDQADIERVSDEIGVGHDPDLWT